MLGRLFILAEVDRPDPMNHVILEALQQEMTARYYQAEDFHAEAAFERALQLVNDRLQSIAAERLPEWLARANLLIAVLKDTTLHFTVVGRVHAFLIHRQRIVDILETSTGASSEVASPLKIFANIISGQLSLDDALLFCTTSLLDYLSQEKLKRIITEHGAQEAARALESLLAESDSTASFGALIVQLTATPSVEEQSVHPAVPREPERLLPQESMEELIRRERRTNELLTHPLWPNLTRLMKSGTKAVNSMVSGAAHRETMQRSGEPPPPRVQPTWTPHTGQRTPSLVRGLRQSFGALGGAVGALLMALIRPVRTPLLQQRLRRAPGGANRRFALTASWVQRLTSARRRVLLLAVVLLILFSQSVVSLGQRQTQRSKTELYASKVREARERLAAADAALLIKNEASARQLLTEATQALDAIPGSYKATADDVTALRQEVEARAQTIRHVVTVTPELLYDAAGLEVGFTGRSMTTIGSTVYIFNEGTASVYAIDRNEKTSDVVLTAPSLDAPLRRFVHDQPAPLLLQQNGALQQLTLTGQSIATVPVGYTSADRDIRAAILYNARLYTLDARAARIARHQKSGTGYGAGTDWMTDASVNLSGAVDMAIDGAVYVLKETGEISKLVSGKKDPAVFAAVDPAWNRPTVIFTTSDLSTVFVLDPGNHRVVEFAKNGGFLRQYTSPQFTDLKDLLVDGNTILVLNGAQIFSFPVTKE